MPRHHLPKAQLIAAAESYAGVGRFADACYRFYFYHDDQACDYLRLALVGEFAHHLKVIDGKYHHAVISTALTELTYPQKSSDRPAFTIKDRACCMGISRGHYYRLQADTIIDDIISHISAIAKAVAGKIRTQLGINFDAGY